MVRILWLLVLIGFILGLIQISQPMMAESDAYSRVMVSRGSFLEGDLINKGEFRGMWLPLHFVVMTLSLMIYDSLHFSPRFIILLFNLGSIPLLYYFSLIIFGKTQKAKWKALLVSVIYLVLPLRYFLATITLSEPMFIVFLVGAIILFFKKKPQYMWGLLVLGFAQALRYEAWFFVPILWWFLILDKNISSHKKILYGGLSLIFPMFWLGYSWYQWGDFLSFYQTKISRAQTYSVPEYYDLFLSLKIWIIRWIESFSLFGVFLVIVGYYKLLKKRFSKKQILLLFLPFYFFFLLVAQVFLGTMEWFPHRYLLIPIALSLPIFVEGIIKCIIFLKKKISISCLPFYFVIFVIVFMDMFTTISNVKESVEITMVGHKENLLEVVGFMKNKEENLCNGRENVVYLIDKYRRKWLEGAFHYSTQLESMRISSYDKYRDIHSGNNECLVFVAERSAWQYQKDKPEPVFINSDFVVFIEK